MTGTTNTDDPASAVALRQRVELVEIKSEAQYRVAIELFRVARDYLRQVARTFDPIEEKQAEALAETRRQRAAFDGPATVAMNLAKQKAEQWLEQQRLNEEALRISTERAARTAIEDHREAVAVQASEDGATDDEVFEIIDHFAVPDSLVSAAASVAMPKREKAEGTIEKTVWTFEITDKKQIALRYMSPNVKLIRTTVIQFQREAEEIVGGIRVFSKPKVSVRD